MQVLSWMSRPVHTITPATVAADAIGLLRRHRIRHLPIMEGDRVIGIVTDRDLRGVGPDTPVAAIMSHPVVVVSPRTAIDKVARILFDRRIGCVPVVEDGKLVGILTQTDAVKALVNVVRTQVGGRHADVTVAYRRDAMALAHRALRSLGPYVARLVTAVVDPPGPGVPPERVRLDIETREMVRTMEALRAAGLEILETTTDDDGVP
jgi:acetoin utilization protein AcuB